MDILFNRIIFFNLKTFAMILSKIIIVWETKCGVFVVYKPQSSKLTVALEINPFDSNKAINLIIFMH